MKRNISHLREEIDCLDFKILKLIEERANLVKEVGEIKGKTNSAIYVPEREENIFKSLAQNSNLLTYENIRGIFTEIISSCRNLEKHLTVFTLGEFSSLVAYRVFGNAVSIKKLNHLENFEDFSKEENLFLIDFDFYENYSAGTVVISEITYSNKRFLILKKLRTDEKKINFKPNIINFIGGEI
ncbi:MAG: chorismate mutase [Fusobacteriaceae bacterium]